MKKPRTVRKTIRIRKPLMDRIDAVAARLGSKRMRSRAIRLLVERGLQ